VTLRDLTLRGSYSTNDDRLNNFFVPVLSESVSYDRVTGYFRSTSLRHIARGLSRMLANGGRMRLIAGAEFPDEDIRAIEEGEPLADVLARTLLADPLEATDIVAEHRLETLAWLVREGLLEIKIGVPTDHLGRPIRRHQTVAYFHAKYGVFTDEEGDRVTFEGSNNESDAGHALNYETFSVAASWLPEVWAWSGQPVVDRFEAHWNGHPDIGWKILPLPDAVRDRLVERLKPSAGPPQPPDLEEAPKADDKSQAALLAYVAAAPTINGGTGVGFATAGVEPLPYQLSIARRVVDTYPRSYLLADEVGLGKTIEAGLVIRELLVSQRASRVLILVPASVLKQWQEELDEKLALRVPRLDAGKFFFRRGGLDEEIMPGSASENPWGAFPILLASSHLARRRAQRPKVIDTGPWDVVFVDEAHHARRRGSKPTDTPNSLLALLQEMRAARSWNALYLASATPMQMNAHEAWDLLELLELTRLWGRSAEDFVRYYEELREPFGARHWDFLQRMSADYLEDPAASLDADLEVAVRREVGFAASRPIREFHRDGLTPAAADTFSADARLWLDQWLRRHTPTSDRIFRTTRKTLREYKAQGLLPPGTTIPQRSVLDRFVPMTSEESALYERIESYISRYYDAYLSGPGSQKPLGFIMTVYRRRLTSSFLAIERSLQRRRKALMDRASADALLDADDLAAIEFSLLLDPDELPQIAQDLAGEVHEIDDFLEDLARRPPDESKMQYLHNELEEAFKSVHDTAIIFTQYTDTMDYVRSQLVTFYGSKVVCWSGRGGERWDPDLKAWVVIPKVDVKNLFRDGKDVKILVGTDSMSEGLNLQTSGLLINYDMPWNFMRVEQRIGRVDRIGGKPVVDIRNYFYADTVEEQIYAGIKEDFDWFTDIVGPAQPVLGQIEGAIEEVAMKARTGERDKAVETKLDEIRVAIARAHDRALTLEDLGSTAVLGDSPRPAIDLRGLERVLLGVERTSGYFHPHPDVDGAYLLDTPKGKEPITFRRSVLEKYTPEIRLLTYGAEEFDGLLAAVGRSYEWDDSMPGTLADLERQLQTPVD
jgi:SNF2 domain-containing protein/helicase-like protein